MGQYCYISTVLWPMIDFRIVILINILRKVTYLLPAVEYILQSAMLLVVFMSFHCSVWLPWQLSVLKLKILKKAGSPSNAPDGFH